MNVHNYTVNYNYCCCLSTTPLTTASSAFIAGIIDIAAASVTTSVAEDAGSVTITLERSGDRECRGNRWSAAPRLVSCHFVFSVSHSSWQSS